MPRKSDNGLHAFYCSSCGHFLNARGRIVQGELELYCRNCKEWTVVTDAQRVMALPGVGGLDKAPKKR